MFIIYLKVIKKINLNENLFHFLNMHTLNILCFLCIYIFIFIFLYIFCKFYTFKFLHKYPQSNYQNSFILFEFIEKIKNINIYLN